MKSRIAVLAASLLAGSIGFVQAQNVDVGAAEALAKKSGCTKCHSVSAKKEGRFGKQRRSL